MRIIALPAFQNRKENPYNWLLYSHIEKLGVKVDEASIENLLAKKYQIWHLHWPESSLNKQNILKALVEIQALLILMDLVRLKGTKILWTVHNLKSHEHLYPQLETWFWKAFTQRLDGYISLSKVGMTAAQERFPRLKNLPGFVIPHGHYREEYPDVVSSQQARALLEIPPSTKVLLFFGRIRSYKNIIQLIRAFREFQDPKTILYIAGRPGTPALEQDLRTEATLDDRVKMHLDFIPKDKAQLYFRAADLVVLPYREILNSGSALLALSFSCPVLVPLQGALSELQAQVGQEWVYTYEGEIISSHMEAALEWALQKPRFQPAPLENFNWNNLAQQTIEAYKKIGVDS
jgi:glycosyltransferase involved in cell wall biosynthesis